MLAKGEGDLEPKAGGYIWVVDMGQEGSSSVEGATGAKLPYSEVEKGERLA